MGSREVTTTDLKDVVNKLIPDSIARDIEKACQGIYPLHDVHIRKVKLMKRPRFDLNKLMDARRGQRQSRCDHRRCHRRSCGATRGIRASSAGVRLDYVSMALNKA